MADTAVLRGVTMLAKTKILLVGATAMFLLAGSANASNYVEQGDAGQSLLTAASTMTSGQPSILSSITGFYDGVDADLFKIYISDAKGFSATTVNADTSQDIDTALFLLDAAGHAVATNDDDASGLFISSTLPVGNRLYSNLSAGAYYLGIADSGNEPVNLNNQLLFSPYTNGSSTSVRGAAGGLNPTALAGFGGNTYEDVSGSYRIDLTGVSTGPIVAAVPETATWAMMIIGFGVAGVAMRRRNHVRSTVRFA